MKSLIAPVACAVALTLATAPAQAGSCGGSAHSHADEAGYEKKADIVQTAVNAGTFKTLAAALTEAELVEALQAEGPFTVFAPTDEAFARLPEGTVESLLKPENRDQLVAILTYHVVPGELTADKVVSRDDAKTLNGKKLSFRTKDGSVLINGAKVVTADVKASNGVIHVIDTVLLPSE